MDRLWIRFSLAFMVVIIIALTLPLASGLLSEWFFDALYHENEGSTLFVDPTVLTDDEVAKLANILPADKFDKVMTALDFYTMPPNDTIGETIIATSDEFESIGVLSPDEIKQLSVLLPPQKFGKIMDFIALSGMNFGDDIIIVGLLPEDINWMEQFLSPDEFVQLMNFFATDETVFTDFGGWEPISLVDILQLIAEELPQVIIVSALIGLILGVLMSRSLTAPLTRLTEAAQAIGAQDLSRRVAVKGSREIKTLANTLNIMASNLEQAEQLRRNMMADVSHELRTPLTVLEGNLRAALDKVYQLDEEDMAQLYTQTHHLTLLVNDLHELTLAEARKLPLKFEETDVAKLIQETASIFEPLAQDDNISLNYHLRDDIPTVQADPARVRQVLHNLLANALRHTPSGGRIDIDVCASDEFVSIVIKDSGDGIAPEHLEQVFERFYRADPARARTTGGAGLGLAIVKAIVEAHHGHIRVSSEGVGKGSTFTIELPKKQVSLITIR